MKTHSIFCLLFFALFLSGNVYAQSIPNVPSSLSFGGIEVKFDRGAQKIIEEDINSLMSNKKFWEEKMERAILFFPIVESILMDEEVPIDFKYLAVQESSFKSDVVSSSKAVGYWQLKAETAIELNLRVDDQVDERKNIVSSTYGAAWYLKKNNLQFKNWVSTLFSYYLGAGGVKKVVPAGWVNAREISLTSKTDRYVLRFFAHKIALEAGIESFRSQSDIVLFQTVYGKGLTFREIAQSLNVDVNLLSEYNRWFQGDRVPNDREYFIIVPANKNQVAEVRSKLALPPQITASVPAYEPSGYPILKKSNVSSTTKNGYNFYEMNGMPGIEAKPGDKVKTIAKAGKVSVSSFMKNNDMQRDMPVIPGNVYYLVKKKKRADTPFHVAHPGDTWQSVSQDYGIRLVNLLKYNRTISRNFPIETGQKLWLTKKRPRKQPIEIVPPTLMIPENNKTEQLANNKEVMNQNESSANDIPSSPSGRVKYSPILVDKSAVETVKDISVENKPVTEKTAPEITKSENIYTKPTASNDDRVVIIKGGDAEISKQPTTNADQTETGDNLFFESEVAKKTPVRKSNTSNGTHIVVNGDTYFSIARNYNISVRELLALNNRTVDTGLQAGEALNIRIGKEIEVKEQPAKVLPKPVEKWVEKPEPQKSPEKTRSNIFHQVESGQTYFSISKLYNLSVDELLRLNALSVNDKLYVGQKLLVEKMEGTPVAPKAPTRDATTHKVSKGETLYSISQMHHVSVDAIKKANNMNSNTVVLGEELKIPQQK